MLFYSTRGSHWGSSRSIKVRMDSNQTRRVRAARRQTFPHRSTECEPVVSPPAALNRISEQPAWRDPSASHHLAKKLKRCQETSDDSFLYPLSSLSALYVFPLAWQPEVSNVITPQILSGALFSPRTAADFTLIRHVTDLRAWIVSFLVLVQWNNTTHKHVWVI